MTTLINPHVRWAMLPSERSSLEYIEGVWDPSDTLPYEGDVITRPFLVDPQTRQPVPVRVVQIQEILETQGHILAVVVTRADRNH